MKEPRLVRFLFLTRLFKDGGGRKLKHLDVSGCVGITDKTLVKLTSVHGKPSKWDRGSKCADCNCQKQTGDSSENSKHRLLSGLECLRLSGCYKITDDGLR